MKIKYALHSIDTHPLYKDFWNPVSKIWKLKFNIEPVLIVIEEKEKFVLKNYSTKYGTVVNIEPVENIPTHLQAQWARFWYTVNFLDSVCIISDIDMFPISKKYFVEQIEKINDENYVHLYSNFYPHFCVCYHVAKGNTFKEVLGLPDSFEGSIKEMMNHDKQGCHNHLGMEMWGLEEIFSSSRINDYILKNGKDKFTLFKRSERFDERIRRVRWGYDPNLLKEDYYIDCHSIRPYHQYKNEIEILVEQIIGVNE